MGKEAMTPRERWLAVLNGDPPDRLPTDYWATEEATARLLKQLGCADEEEMYHRLHIDRPVRVRLRYVGPSLPEDRDEFGCGYRDVDYGCGVYRECVSHPLAEYDSVEEVEANYTWPSPDWWDYSVVREQVKGKEHRPVRAGGSEPFLTYKNLRGQEQAFMDLLLAPDMVHYCLDWLFDLCHEMTRRIYEHIPGMVTFSSVSEDLGSQQGLLFSPAQIREFLLPRMKRMMDLAHGAGAYVFHHTDGAVREILPDLIEAGIDILNPVQWRCPGMDREGLKRDFGDSVVFHGAVDNQYTLAFGSVEEVRQEVIDNIAILGRGGYILAPCHNIQAISPPENVVAMYETAYRDGRI